MKKLRIVVHDFVGHAFQVGLSREMARRGHDVQHVYFAGFKSPNGPIVSRPSDPTGLTINPVKLPSEYPKYQFAKRFLADRRYMKECIRQISSFHPDVVLSGGASPAVQKGILRNCRRNGIGFVSWVQDCYGIAAKKIFSKQLGFVGSAIGSYVSQNEESTIRASDHVVYISGDFHSAFPGVAREKVTVIENWAPLDELPLRPRTNLWSIANQLVDKKVLLYTGTLGLKHNPEMLVQLALGLRQRPEAVLVVISEGLGRSYLEERKKALNLSNLLLLNFQPFDALPDVTASADVLIAMVEKEAGAFSVPSKVLTYLCASRPLLLSIPSSNLAARIVTRNNAGVVVEPSDVEGFVRAAQDLLTDRDRALALASHARAYALATFDIIRIADGFEDVLWKALQDRPLPQNIDALTSSAPE